MKSRIFRHLTLMATAVLLLIPVQSMAEFTKGQLGVKSIDRVPAGSVFRVRIVTPAKNVEKIYLIPYNDSILRTPALEKLTIPLYRTEEVLPGVVKTAQVAGEWYLTVQVLLAGAKSFDQVSDVKQLGAYTRVMFKCGLVIDVRTEW